MEFLSKSRRAKLEASISLENLAHNFDAIRAYTDKRICCVIKADAYGHGAWSCARYLASRGADYFAVSSVAEAEEVRAALADADKKIGILILGYTLPADVDILIRLGISQTVFSQEYAQALQASIREYKLDGTLPSDAKLSVHIKLDTGMNRLGFRPWDTPSDLDAITTISGVRDFAMEGIFTHFAQSDTPGASMTDMQFARYREAVEALESRGVHFPIRHVCNSAAITNFPRDMQLDMVRYGIELYGLMPSAETALPKAGLKPVMTLKTVVSHIHTVRAGESIGYGGTYIPDHDIRVATLPIGYADGFIRAYGEGGWVQIRGRRAPVRGRICMDQCMVDVSDIPGVRPGDEVLLFGEGTQSADDIAARAGTIGYEVLCLIGKRVPRVYVQ
ncbi:MAG: alanine racemase [Clostridia bacterium]|nr:alanine racemase [Clostridia bacterium]